MSDELTRIAQSRFPFPFPPRRNQFPLPSRSARLAPTANRNHSTGAKLAPQNPNPNSARLGSNPSQNPSQNPSRNPKSDVISQWPPTCQGANLTLTQRSTALGALTACHTVYDRRSVHSFHWPMTNSATQSTHFKLLSRPESLSCATGSSPINVVITSVLSLLLLLCCCRFTVISKPSQAKPSPKSSRVLSLIKVS